MRIALPAVNHRSVAASPTIQLFNYMCALLRIMDC